MNFSAADLASLAKEAQEVQQENNGNGMDVDGSPATPSPRQSSADHDGGMEVDQEQSSIMDSAEAHRLFKLAREPSEILPNLFLGTARHALNQGFLAKHNVTYILCVADTCRFPSRQYTFRHVPISDYGDTVLDSPQVFGRCFEFIEQAVLSNKSILVHCTLGINRSPCVVIAYLMWKKHWPLKQAYEHVLSRRSSIAPHEDYFTALRRYELKLFGKQSVPESQKPVSMQSQLKEWMKDLAEVNEQRRKEEEAEKKSPQHATQSQPQQQPPQPHAS